MISVDRSQPRNYELRGLRYYAVTDICANLTGQRPYGDEQAKQRGTDLHVIFALAVASFAGRCPPPIVPPLYHGYYRSMMHWIETVKPEPVLIESPSVSVYPHLPFAGTPDLLAWLTLRGRRHLTLVDLKSGIEVKWHRVQVQAYAKLRLYSEAHTLGILYLNKDGECLLKIVKRNPRDWAAFTSALSLLVWRESA